MKLNLSPRSAFGEAARQWLESRRDQLSQGSISNYEQYLVALNRFFGEMRLESIHIGNIEEYQDLRQQTCGAARINHELSMLQQILKRAGLWEEVRKYYEPLKLPAQGIGIALEPEEEEHLFQIARTRPRWRVACCCAIISNNTTAGPKEILSLRLGDIFLENSPPIIMVVQGIKNKYRERALPLNQAAVDAMRQLLEISRKRGSCLPEHYLVPARLKTRPEGYNRSKPNYDVTRPALSFRTAWEKIRAEAGKKFPRLATLRRYDLRHNACTKLLEDPRVAERTIEELMGHRLNSRTKERYSHIRLQKKIAAVDILCEKQPPAETEPPKRPPQKIEKTATSTVDIFLQFRS